MALLFVSAKDHRITASNLGDLEREFGRPQSRDVRSILKFYQSPAGTQTRWNRAAKRGLP